jgi:Helix-turn-helix domain
VICPVLEPLRKRGGDTTDGAVTGATPLEVRGGFRTDLPGRVEQAEAAEILGVSERTFRRWRDCYEAMGAEGLFDRRLRKISVRRAPVDEVAGLLELFDTRDDATSEISSAFFVAEEGTMAPHQVAARMRARMRCASAS